MKQQLNKIEIKNKKTCPDCRAQCSIDQSRRIYLPIEATKNLETELQNLRKLKDDLFIIAVKKGYLDLYDRLVANQDDKNPTDSKVRMSKLITQGCSHAFDIAGPKVSKIILGPFCLKYCVFLTSTVV